MASLFDKNSFQMTRLQKTAVAKVVGVSLIMLLAACSSDQRYKRQVSGDESYLDAAALHELKAPAGMILPVQNGTYDIQTGTMQGAVGKQLDIRPPSQPLALLNGSQTQFAGDTSTVLLENTAQNRDLWNSVVKAVEQNKYKIASRDDANQTLSTDFVDWNRADEDFQYQGRYQISVKQQSYQLALTVKTLELKQQDKAVTSTAEIQRYNSQMMNSITSSLDKVQQDTQARLDNRRVGEIDVQSGADDTGLPVLIVRATYGVVWDRLPNALAKAGMKVTDSSRPQGTLSVTYKPLNDDAWQTLGAKDPGLTSGDYKLQVGDLDNRSSLQFLDPKGHALSQSQNDAMVAVMQAAFSQSSAK
ncbi:outer membrane protein assembly factor BamC [Rahnella sp. AA]|uniref:outer membrane protein assembly factor BamC n=1 Tax=Rahnella sp. AA TaxID=2057180 RepID=UPI000C336C4C|nr:outer membrane protein assembly factor BamC [Rahnella sp. AA]PKE33098.1 outer membrane protein assembly factor BamC [Rahnella sp. AA]